MKYDFEMGARLAKPCPLCGSRKIVTSTRAYEETVHDRMGSGNYYKTLECKSCGCRYTGDPAPTQDEAYRLALRHWNRRAIAC